MIDVTRPFLPPIGEYVHFLEGIWERNWLTNNGPLVLELEAELRRYLDLDQVLYLANGTLALQIAIKALDLRGEIITTPFSYVATTSSILWENCKPVFVDIDSGTLNIDAARIQAAVTPATTGILATHVYGNPCDIDAVQSVADTNHLKIIYDAAHCFGSIYRGRTLFTYGDVSTTSFHATKLFHTVEGGAVFSADAELFNRMSFMRNFGHDGPERFAEIGINAKNSEFHAAMGLLNLQYIDRILSERRALTNLYDAALKGSALRKPATLPEAVPNAAYYPVIFESEEQLLSAVRLLQANQVAPRRYFYPPLSRFFGETLQDLPVANSLSPRVLCLPLYNGMTEEDVQRVTSTVTASMA